MEAITVGLLLPSKVFKSIGTLLGRSILISRGDEMNIEQWRSKVKRMFPEYVVPAEVALSVVHQLCIADITNPFGLVFIDVPSSGKTTVLNFFADLEDLVYATDKFTPASFVSHASEKKHEELKKIDLLPRIKNKVFLVRDFAPIFGMRDDDLLKTMGILTRVFDGEGLVTDSGLYGSRGYKGEYLFMFLGASTPISPRVWKVMSGFGSRLYFFNMNTPDKNHVELARQLKSNYSFKEKELKCRKYTKELCKETFRGIKKINWDREKDNEQLLEEIAIVSQLVASLRGTIYVWKSEGRREANHTAPLIEKPDRINQALYNLARGHAIVCGRTRLADIDIGYVIQVALSSGPLERVKLFNLLIAHDGQLETQTIMDSLGFSRPTSLNLMEMLKHLKLVKEIIEDIPGLGKKPGRTETRIKLKKRYAWFISERFKTLKNLPQGQI